VACSGAFFAALTTVFVTAAFFATARASFAVARFAAHLFLVAAIIRFITSSLIWRFGLAGSGVVGVHGDSATPLDADHRFRGPSLMRFRAAALILRRSCRNARGAGLAMRAAMWFNTA
jgi:hypothetical protein